MLTEIAIDLTWKIPLVILIASVAEWLIHRYLLHGRWLYRHGPRWTSWIYRWHAIEHHAGGENHYRPHIDLRPWDYFPVLPFLALACWRYWGLGHLGGLTSLIAQMTVCGLHMVLWNGMHRAIHGLEPGNWATRLPWYRYVARHHEQHHRNVRTNLNIVFPFCDWLMRTSR